MDDIPPPDLGLSVITDKKESFSFKMDQIRALKLSNMEVRINISSDCYKVHFWIIPDYMCAQGSYRIVSDYSFQFAARSTSEKSNVCVFSQTNAKELSMFIQSTSKSINTTFYNSLMERKSNLNGIQKDFLGFSFTEPFFLMLNGAYQSSITYSISSKTVSSECGIEIIPMNINGVIAIQPGSMYISDITCQSYVEGVLSIVVLGLSFTIITILCLCLVQVSGVFDICFLCHPKQDVEYIQMQKTNDVEEEEFDNIE